MMLINTRTAKLYVHRANNRCSRLFLIQQHFSLYSFVIFILSFFLNSKHWRNCAPLGISSSTVYRVLKNNRQHRYHYIRVHHLQPEDYPARREFWTWLLNQEMLEPNFVSRILFSDQSNFGRQACYIAHNNLHIWKEENPRAIVPRAFQERFSLNL
jgi:hypothetical protein